MRRLALLLLALLGAGCGPSPGPTVAPPCGPRSDPQALSWLGERPADADAAKAWDGAHRLLATGKDEEEFREIGLLAFYPETLPALVELIDKGCDLQVRAAFNGLRAVLDGVMANYYLPDPAAGRLEAHRARVLPWLRDAAHRSRLEAGLARLPEPSRKVFAPMVERLAVR